MLVFDEAVGRKLGFGGYTVGIPHERIGGPPIWHIHINIVLFLSVAILVPAACVGKESQSCLKRG